MPTDYGSDLSCVSDLDPGALEVSGRKALAQSIARRLTTPRGRLIDDPNYGFDLTQFIDADLGPADLAQIKAQAEAECLKDERVAAATVTLQFIANVLNVTVVLQDRSGPFALVLSINNVTPPTLAIAA
jgi:phage baseplate assembly protein W